MDPRSSDEDARAWTSLAADVVPPPEVDAEPAGYMVEASAGVRIHFLDWGGPSGRDPAVPGDGEGTAGTGILLIHGIGATAWTWAPVARRLRRLRHVVAMDLRGHGLSDAPTEGYEPPTLAEDVVAVAEGAGLLSEVSVAGVGADPRDQVLLVGHGLGAIVATWAAATLGPRCAALLLVDGGWEDLAASTDLDPATILRELDEPPEVLRSMAAYLGDRRGFDPSTWDADQERAARSTVVELPAGRLVPSIHPHVREACVEAMFAYRPVDDLAAVQAPVGVLVADAGSEDERSTLLRAVSAALASRGRPPLRVARITGAGHNLMRYRPEVVTAATLGLEPH